MHQRVSLPHAWRSVATVLTVDLQHGEGLRLAHAVLRRAGVHAFILLFYVEQPEDVAVVDFKPASGKAVERLCSLPHFRS